MAIDRTAIILSAFHQIPNCAVGFKIDLAKCHASSSQLLDANNLRRAIWLFLTNDIKFMPPHLRQFLRADLKFIGVNYQRKNYQQSTAAANFKIPLIKPPKLKY